MKKIAMIAVALATAAGMSTAAQAQETKSAHPYAGVQVGFHDLGIDEDAVPPLTLDDSAMIYGGYAGVDFDLGSSAIVGIEANLNLGSSAIDAEYGAAARIGYRTTNGTIIYARVGYQWVNVDVENFTGVANPPAGIDDTVDDILVGIGTDIALRDGPARIRLGVDTVSFDTIRGTAGVNFSF